MVQFVDNFNNKYFTFNLIHYIIRVILSFVFSLGLVGGIIGGLHPLVFLLYGLYGLYIVHLKEDKAKWFLFASLSIVTFLMFRVFLYENNIVTSINDSLQFTFIFLSCALNVFYAVYHFINFGAPSTKKPTPTSKKSRKKER